MWLVRKNKILTKENLLNRGWQDSSQCMFCSNSETADHLFVGCLFVKCIWNWIATHNHFHFKGVSLEYIWVIDAMIPYKYSININD
jgi:zinc-binding in reverse transcriptase